jgi:hypothetical protein
MEQLRESLREAARTDIRARRRRRRLRVSAVLALALVGGGAAAEATDLFEKGPAAPDIRGLATERYGPGAGARRQIVVKQRVARVALPVGVAVYRTAEGLDCALAGAINGAELGDIVDGRFRPFAAGRSGTCNAPGRATYDLVSVAGHSFVYGLTATGMHSVSLAETGASARVGPDRAFLLEVPERRMYRVDARE